MQLCIRSAANISSDEQVVRSGAGLRMVRLVPEVSVKKFIAFWFGEASPGRLERHEHGIDFAEDPGVVILKNPTLLRFVIGIKHSQTLRRLARAFLFPPHSIVIASVLHPMIA